MKKKLLTSLWACCFTILISAMVNGQAVVITGTVSDVSDGSLLPGVNVLLKGSTTGAVTNIDGKYTIRVSDQGGILIFSSIGYLSIEVPINNQSVIDISLESDIKQLSEIVVTAIGIERDRKSLGYQIQEVDGDELAQKATNSLADALQGKLAGININAGSGAPGQAPSIVIRGASSISQGNQALIVVDGIPIDNQTVNSENALFGTANSSRIADIDPEDIEEISVLKGPAASALYGTIGVNGAIVIKTKSGKNLALNNQSELTFSTSYTISRATSLPEFQNQYGQGLSGFHSSPNTSNSWGNRFTSEDQTIVDKFGNTIPFRAYPDNVKDFFETGILSTTNIGARGGNQKTNYSFNAGYTNQSGIVPNSELDRLNLRGQFNTHLNDKFSVGANLSYITTGQVGVPQGNNGSSTYFILYSIPRSFDLSQPIFDDQGRQTFYSNGLDNPRFAAETNTFTSEVDRNISIFEAKYQPLEWLDFTYRFGIDTWSDVRKQRYAIGSNSFPTGTLVKQELTYTSYNHDIIGTLKRKITDDLFLTFIGGANIREVNNTSFANVGTTLGVDGFFDVDNASVNNPSENFSQKRTVGVYGDAQLSYKDYLFLGLTGRNDWSSTFNLDNNSYFYGAANAAFVFTDAFTALKNNKILSFGKLRASYGQLGRDAAPYLLRTAYIQGNFGANTSGVQFPFGGTNGFGLSNTAGEPDLQPEIQTEFEVGLQLSLLQNRLGFDVAYYERKVDDLIFFFAGIAPSTGFGFARLNGGELSTTGWEITFNATPIKTNNFTWDIRANFTQYENVVESLPEGFDNLSLGTNRFGGTNAQAIPGQPFGVIVTQKFVRDQSTGKLLVNPRTGLPFANGPTNEVVGDPNPDYVINAFNTFKYKNFRLGFQFDIKVGGDLYSNTIGFATVLGALEETGVDREAPRIIDGILATDETGANSSGVPNNIQIRSQDYWRAFSGGFNEFAVFDASYVRLREVSFGYSLPSKLLNNLPVKSLDISVSGRNLWTYAPNLRHIDPEISSVGPGNGNSYNGFDFGAAPLVQNFAFNLSARF